MNATLLQQAGHRPLSVTRSRHDGQSRGNATSSERRKLARRPIVKRAAQDGCTVATGSMGLG